MDAVALLIFVGSIYLAGRIAERRGRSVKSWAWIAALLGGSHWCSCSRLCTARMAIVPKGVDSLARSQTRIDASLMNVR